MIIKMVNELKLTVVHVAHVADLCMCVELPLDKKLWKIRTGPQAVGRGGPSADGRWAAGLLLAKPTQKH